MIYRSSCTDGTVNSLLYGLLRKCRCFSGSAGCLSERHTLQANKALNRPITLDVRLPVYELRQGMFVSNVDCGWRSTPFPLEGLLITSQEQIGTLTGLTEYVTVDPTRSMDLALTKYLEKHSAAANTGSATTTSPQSPALRRSVMTTSRRQARQPWIIRPNCNC